MFPAGECILCRFKPAPFFSGKTTGRRAAAHMAARLFYPMSVPQELQPTPQDVSPQVKPPSLPPLIAVHGLNINRGGTFLLKNVNWTVRPAQHWAVLGGNGAGKSTLLKAALGLLWPDQTGGGRIVWNLGGGEEESPLAVRAASVLISPQTQAWYAHNAGELSGEELLLCGLYGTPRIYRAVEDADRAQARSLARAFNLGPLLDLGLEAMSQGQLRRMLIASACLARPRILALDEASDGLDSNARKDLFALLEQLAAHGLAAPNMPGAADKNAAAAASAAQTHPAPVTLLMTAHRAEDLPLFITHSLRLEAGQIREQGRTNGPIALSPSQAVTTVGVASAARVSAAGASATKNLAPAAARANTAPASQATPNAPPVLELCNVSVFLGRRPVLRNLNWRVNQGEHWAIAGPNGSGKTTLLRLIWGEIPAALGGEIRWFGRGGPFNIPVLRRRLGLVSDRVHQAIPADLPAEDVVVSGFFGSIGLYEEPTPAMYQTTAEVMQRLDLEYLSGRLFGELSFGEARRLLLARALAHKPQLLLLDEALSGLDATARADFLRALSRAAREENLQIIQVSHHPADFIAEINNVLALEPVDG